MKIIKVGYESECIGYYGPSPGDEDFKPAEKPKKVYRHVRYLEYESGNRVWDDGTKEFDEKFERYRVLCMEGK